MAEDSLLWPTAQAIVEEQVTATSKAPTQGALSMELENAARRSGAAVEKMLNNDWSLGAASDQNYARRVQQPPTSSGAASRQKTLHVTGDAAVLAARLEAL